MKPLRQTLKEGWVPFMFVHMLAYPLAFLWAIASMPILLAHLDVSSVESGETTLNLWFFVMRMPVAAKAILWQTMGAAGLPLAIGNVLAVWVSVNPSERAKKCAVVFVALFSFGAVAAIAGWARILTMK